MLDTERCMETVRERIIDEYKKSGITSIEKFSEKCKVSYNTIWGIVSKNKLKSDIRLSTLIIIANALNRPVSWLIGEDG